jgi:hypothetical protein
VLTASSKTAMPAVLFSKTGRQARMGWPARTDPGSSTALLTVAVSWVPSESASVTARAVMTPL